MKKTPQIKNRPKLPMKAFTRPSLDSLLQIAEEAKERPPLPENGLPKQKLPNWARLIFKSIVLPFLYIELLAEKIAKAIIRPPFTPVGKCKRRGNCCHYILFPETHGILKKLFLFWNTEVQGFFPRDGMTYEHEGKKVMAMGCRHLRENGSCSNHFFRPKVCRSWPMIKYFGYPKILKGCGYKAKLRKSYAKKHPALHILEDDNSPK